jgi:hypothetical protein
MLFFLQDSTWSNNRTVPLISFLILLAAIASTGKKYIAICNDVAKAVTSCDRDPPIGKYCLT